MSTDLMLTHASLDTYMSLEKNLADVDWLVSGAGGDRLVITLTETAEDRVIEGIRRVVGKRYQVVNPDAGDITFLVHRELKVKSSGGPLVVPAVHKPASKGGHGPRHNSWVRMEYDGEDWTHNGVHTVTALAGQRESEQVYQLRKLGQQMNRQGQGRRVATGSGDLNGNLPSCEDLQAVFDQYNLTTAAAETNTWTPTHGKARLDYTWTRDADSRVVVNRMTVRRHADRNSDHDPIDTWATIN